MTKGSPLTSRLQPRVSRLSDKTKSQAGNFNQMIQLPLLTLSVLLDVRFSWAHEFEIADYGSSTIRPKVR